MKKILSLMLIAVFMLSFTACSSTDQSTNPTEAHNHTHYQEGDQTSSQPDSNGSDSAEKENIQNSSAELSRGKYNDNTYKNDVMNLSFELPSGWVFYSDEELSSISGLSSELFSNFTNAAQSNPAVYDMYAINKETGASASLCYENLLYTTGSTLTAKEYLEFIKAAVAGAGVSDIEDHGTVDFCSGKYESATITSGTGEVKNRHTYYLSAFENYMVTIIITSTSEATESDIIANFS